MSKDNDRIEYGDVHYAPDGTKLIADSPCTDGAGCVVCDGCWYLKHDEFECPRCRGPQSWIDYTWGVVCKTEKQIQEEREYERQRAASHDWIDDDPTNYW